MGIDLGCICILLCKKWFHTTRERCKVALSVQLPMSRLLEIGIKIVTTTDALAQVILYTGVASNYIINLKVRKERQ